MFLSHESSHNQVCCSRGSGVAIGESILVVLDTMNHRSDSQNIGNSGRNPQPSVSGCPRVSKFSRPFRAGQGRARMCSSQCIQVLGFSDAVTETFYRLQGTIITLDGVLIQRIVGFGEWCKPCRDTWQMLRNVGLFRSFERLCGRSAPQGQGTCTGVGRVLWYSSKDIVDEADGSRRRTLRSSSNHSSLRLLRNRNFSITERRDNNDEIRRSSAMSLML